MPLTARGPLGTSPGADALVVEIWNRDGVEVYLSQPQRRLPQYRQLGFNTVATESGEWRVFTTVAGDQVVQVAQPMKVRRELAASMALRTILPLFAVVPFLAVAVWFGIARGVAPLERLAAAVGRRSPRTLTPLAESGLPREVLPLVRALNGLLARLEGALDAQRAFIADAAHELRTPLTALRGSIEVALRSERTPDEYRRVLGSSLEDVERLTRVAEDLLLLSRATAGLEVPRRTVELEPLVIEVLDLGTQLGQRAGVTVRAKELAPLSVRGEEGALRRAVTNLVENAIKYTPRGGAVDLALTRAENRAVISVADTGIGIPAVDLERIFEPFVRLDAARARDTGGTGLGLAIARSIVAAHDGTISVESTPGSGSRFTIRLPLG
jgi:heavy metal sensor kinase